MNDETLLEEAKRGDEKSLEKLLSKYKSLATKISRRYFLAGQDFDDIYQEAMIGLFKAYQYYKYDDKNEFKHFATLCINRQIQSAVKSANRLKNKPLNESISLNNQGGIDVGIEDEDGENLFLIIPSPEQLPDDKLISKEYIETIKSEIYKRLSKFELQVLSLYLKGLTYKKIANQLNKTTKSVENSLTRIKSKLSFLK